MCIQYSTCMMQPFLHRTPIQMMQQMGPLPVSSMTPKLMVCVNVLYPYVCAACVHMWLLTVTLLYISFLADWSTEGCVIITEDAATVTCACNHLTAFSILQVQNTHTQTFTHTRAHTHTHTHTHTHMCAYICTHIYTHMYTDHNMCCMVQLVHFFTCTESSWSSCFKSGHSHIGGHPICSGWGSVPCPGCHRSGLPNLEVCDCACWKHTAQHMFEHIHTDKYTHAHTHTHSTHTHTHTHTHTLTYTHSHTHTHTHNIARTFTTFFLHKISTQDSPQVTDRCHVGRDIAVGSGNK